MLVRYLMRYPSWSNPRLWQKEDGFIKRKESLLQYFMALGGISKDVIEDLIGKIMVGIDNTEAWKSAIGFDISKRDFSGNIMQVSVEVTAP